MNIPHTNHHLYRSVWAAVLLATAGTALGAPPATYCIRDLGAFAGQSQAFAFSAGGVPVGSSIDDASNIRGARFGSIMPDNLGPLPPFSQSLALAGAADGAALLTGYTPGTPGYTGARVPSDAAPPTSLGSLLARGANSAGLIVGVVNVTTVDKLTFDRAVRRDATGTITQLPMLSGGLASSAAAINDSGWTVGWSFPTANRRPRAVLWVGSAKPVDLGVLGTPAKQVAMAQAAAINASGLIVGCSTTRAGPTHACLWTMKSATKVKSRTDLGTLAPGASSFATGINAAGDIVGDSDGRAFIFSAGQLIDLNARIAPEAGWILSAASAIDDAGRIVGWGTHEGRPAAFMLSVTCPADIAGLLGQGPDGQVTVDDAIAFANAFSRDVHGLPARAGAADIAGLGGQVGPDGVLSADDVAAFVLSFAEGCP